MAETHEHHATDGHGQPAPMVEKVTENPVTQEDLTQKLANLLGCRIRTRGTHCRGRVETVCICTPAEGGTA